MTHNAKDFLKLRELILKNCVYNQLLQAYLLDKHNNIKVGHSLVRVYGKLMRYIVESKGEKAKLPRFVLADIVVSLGTDLRIGHSYNDFPVINMKVIKRQGSQLSSLKHLADEISKTYSIHASKQDKIFSKFPQSLPILLERNQISSHFWCTGLSKRFKNVSGEFIDEPELERYYKNLYSRLNDWRNFNTILIQLINNGQFELENPGFGKISIQPISFNSSLSCTFHSYQDSQFLHDIVDYSSFTPINWEVENNSIDIFTIRKLFAQ